MCLVLFFVGETNMWPVSQTKHMEKNPGQEWQRASQPQEKFAPEEKRSIHNPPEKATKSAPSCTNKRRDNSKCGLS